jgi:transcriptional regulator with XRE-family HTH domain
MSRTIGSYQWIDKDPILDFFKSARETSGMSFEEIAEHSGVSKQTLRNWDFGSTRKPQRLTMRAAMEAMGFTEQWISSEGQRLEVVYAKGEDFGRVIRRRGGTS